jgi:hypothetical protein
MELRSNLDGSLPHYSRGCPDRSRENFTTLHRGMRSAFRRFLSAV